MVPPSAASSRPVAAAIAPVKAPRSWPKSWLSIRCSGRLAQFSRTKGRAARGDISWTTDATRSLPTPVSPRISKLTRAGATRFNV